jgi:hypothetical protein
MKKATRPTSKRSRSPATPSEYALDYSRAKPNRFAGRFGSGTFVITLDPDVAAVFTSSESVNSLLRSVIAAVPKARSSRRAGTT